MPDAWNGLYKILLSAADKESESTRPPPPLILAAWHHTLTIDKLLRFREQLEWARDHGVLDKVGQYLRGLSEEQWCHYGEV